MADFEVGDYLLITRNTGDIKAGDWCQIDRVDCEDTTIPYRVIDNIGNHNGWWWVGHDAFHYKASLLRKMRGGFLPPPDPLTSSGLPKYALIDSLVELEDRIPLEPGDVVQGTEVEDYERRGNILMFTLVSGEPPVFLPTEYFIKLTGKTIG